MGQQNKEMDVESLQSSGRQRKSCLNVLIVASIIFLFVALAAVSVCGAIIVTKLQSKLDSLRPSDESQMAKLEGNTPSPVYKMQNFVYLEANSSKLKNSSMQFYSFKYGEGTTVGSNFLFNPNQNSVKPKRVGNYFMYFNLNLKCTNNCSAGFLRVRVGDKLTCEVQLQKAPGSTPVSKNCWTVSKLEEEGLVTQMTVSAGLQGWKLELNSGFGMFLVD